MKPETAFNQPAMPVNSLPFIERVEEILHENRVNNFEALPEEEQVKVKACMFILLSQLFGQLFKVDSMDLYKELEEDYENRERKFQV